MDWQWITGPLVGSVIGYITNDIAVRMMFRPYEEKRVFGRRVPFTPGLIPKERARLARAIRDVLDQELLSPAVLENALLSETMLAQIDQAADKALQAILREERTPRALLEGAVGEESLARFEESARNTVSIFLMEKLLESGIEQTVAEIVVEEARKRVTAGTAGIARLFWDDKRSNSLEASLSQTIREMLATHAPEFIGKAIDGALHEGMDTPVATLLDRHADKADDVRAFVVSLYERAIRQGLTYALRFLDLGAIVENRIASLDMRELETLIMQVMRKELRAIVWLGAGLGAVMGLLNAVAGLFL
ncbi:DUF445 family protein [Eubacteriales bacterium OttesenSCG-928-A19]|nr:DUF445 family protein [Eubacteriales bacterium OttesenSCG-928-A19]